MPSLVTSIIGGIQGASAAKNASAAVQAGNTAAAKTVNDATSTVNPLIGAAADKAGAGVTDASKLAGSGVVDASKTAGSGVVDASQQAGTGVVGAAGNANDRLSPYASAGSQASGTLATMLAPGGDLTKGFSGVDLQNDPGYQFRLQQGQEALARSAAARGGVQNGGFDKALTDYTQGKASDEFGSAFQRFQENRQQTYNMLKGVSDSGQSAATTQGTNDIGGARYAGDTNIAGEKYAGDVNIGGATYAGDKSVGGSIYAGNAGINATNHEAQNTLDAANFTGQSQMSSGQAKGAGMIGSANAWNGMLSGIGQAANGAVAGGFGGGGGFSLTGAAKGLSPAVYAPASPYAPQYRT